MRFRVIGNVILVALCVLLLSGGGRSLAQGGGNYFDDITVGGDIDIYGTGVIRDSLDDTVQAQVTSGRWTVAGATDSPNIYGGYVGNAVTSGTQGAFIGGGGAAPDPINWLYGVNTISGNYSAIAGGTSNRSQAIWGSIGGGAGNQIYQYAAYSTISGGNTNSASGSANTIGGGSGNAILGQSGTIGGGYANYVKGTLATIAGGDYNYTGMGSGQAILGGRYNTIGTGRHGWYSTPITESLPNHREPYSFLTDMYGTASGDYSAIVGGAFNAIGDPYSFIGSGYENWIAGFYSRTVTAPGWELYDTAGCITNTLWVNCPGTFNTIVGGQWNEISNAYISYDEVAGELCQVDGYAFIGGGFQNAITGTLAQGSFIGGGVSNTITSTYGTIGGGLENEVTGLYATVPGGAKNVARGEYSLAAGRRAGALHDGSFVWADSQDADYESLADNTFNIRAKGGVRMTTSGAGLSLDGPIIVNGMAFTYTQPITITGVLTNVRLLYYQIP